MSQAPTEKLLLELHLRTHFGRCLIQETLMSRRRIKSLRALTWLSLKNSLTYQFSRNQLKFLQSPRAITMLKTFGSSNLKALRFGMTCSENAVPYAVLLPSTLRKTLLRNHLRMSLVKNHREVGLKDELLISHRNRSSIINYTFPILNVINANGIKHGWSV